MELESIFIGLILGTILGIAYTYYVMARRNSNVPQRKTIPRQETPRQAAPQPRVEPPRIRRGVRIMDTSPLTLNDPEPVEPELEPTITNTSTSRSFDDAEDIHKRIDELKKLEQQQ